MFEKVVELSKEATPQKYQEFYILWQNTYQETYGKMFDSKSMRTSKETFENFVRNTSVDMSLFKSWIATLEKLSQKIKELSEQKADPETYKEFYNLWAKIYADTFISVSKIWMKSYPSPADAV